MKKSIVVLLLYSTTLLGNIPYVCFDNRSSTTFNLIELYTSIQAAKPTFTRMPVDKTITLEAEDTTTLTISVEQTLVVNVPSFLRKAPMCTITISHNDMPVAQKKIPEGPLMFIICDEDDPCASYNTLHCGAYKIHLYVMHTAPKNMLIME